MEKKMFDIIILGGGIAGSLTAISIKRINPGLEILIIEKSSIFHFKVGESSAELTGLFLNRFNINHILKKQIPKAGLRFTFNEHHSDDFSKMDEFCSPVLKGITNGYHLNRQQFDSDLLDEAEKLGARVLRAAEIVDLKFQKLNSEVSVNHEGEVLDFKATWIVDASGPERIVNKKLNWGKKELKFETAASFAHFEGLKPASEWDIIKNDYWEQNAIGPRSESTIHFLRPGCWWWHIVINNNTTSIGIVYDKNILKHEEPEKLFDDFIKNDEQLNFIIGDAKRTAIRHLPALPFISAKLYDEGIAVIGDAAAFIDPLFSPGIEFICQQSIHLSELITDYFTKSKMNHSKWKSYEHIFLNGFADRILVYEDKYKVMGSFDLFSNWVQLDFVAYFSFHVIPSVKFPNYIKQPPRFNFLTRALYLFFANRYVKISERRALQGRNSSSLNKPITFSHVSLPEGFRLYLKPMHLFIVWLSNYSKIEWTEMKYFIFKR
jgi:flavin-dependent dehydrogenase